MLWRNRVSCRRLISIDVDADVSKYGGFNDMVMQNKRKGFTLIEVVTTVFIIGLLVLLVLPNVNHVRAFAERKQQTALVQTVQTQVDLYRNENGSAPASLKDLADKSYLSEGQLAQIDKAAITLKGDQVVAGKK